MLTRSSQYALQALIEIAHYEKKGPVSRNLIAEKTQLPSKFLSKLLSDLVRAGILESRRGPGGGFILAHPAREIPLINIVSLYEKLTQKRCPFGNQECSDDHPCLAHPQWKQVLQTREAFFRTMTLDDIASDAVI